MDCPIYDQAENILRELEKFPNYLRRLEYTMLSLKEILMVAEKQEYSHDLYNWLMELQGVFTQIEELLDEFKGKVDPQEAIGKQVFVPSLFSSRCEDTKKMKKLCNDLDEIASKMYTFNLTMETSHSFLSATEVSTRLMKPSWQLLYPLINAPTEFNENRFANFLKHFNSTDGYFHIVGDAGIGKSTLAKYIYNSPDVLSKFEPRLWICVKEEFNTQRLIKEMLSFSYCQTTCDSLTVKQMQFTVEQFLREKTFLLVFQDMSIKNLDNSSMFQSLLGMGKENSKIIVTTQNEKIADAIGLKKLHKKEEQVDSSPNIKNEKTYQTIFKVEKLSRDNAKSLFKVHAFSGAQEGQNLNLTDDDIEKVLEHKCQRVPLAIKCVGSLLSSKTSEAEQKRVSQMLLKQKEGEDKSILPTLRLCYDLMPFHLQRCFLFCSQLTKDRILSSNDVIQLWIAHGLLPKENYLSLEKLGENYFKELCSRCFLQELEEYGLGYWFKLHPLIQKLARTLTQKQVFPDEPISIAFTVRDEVHPSASLAKICIQNFKHLRLLYLGNANLQEIPNAVGTLTQLRYLDLQGNKGFKRLPNSICSLKNLQTLILASCSALEELPHDIGKLIHLRYLWVTTNKLHLNKNGIGTMTSLRFLAIGGCENLNDLFEQPPCLVRLQTLMIYDCKTLKSLPNQMGSLLSLQNLVIWSCKQLTLTLKGVEFKLRRFTIRDLPKVNKLPDWLQRFTKTLRVLEIIDSPIELEDDKFKTYKALERISIHGVVRVKHLNEEPRYEFKNYVSRREVKKQMETRCYY